MEAISPEQDTRPEEGRPHIVIWFEDEASAKANILFRNNVFVSQALLAAVMLEFEAKWLMSQNKNIQEYEKVQQEKARQSIITPSNRGKIQVPEMNFNERDLSV